MAKLKVVQCWDDGVTSDISLVNLLHKYNAKATFNLDMGRHPEIRREAFWNHDPNFSEYTFKGYRMGKLSLNDIRELYQGFEVASHCWLHENARVISAEAFVESALHARHALEDMFQKECRGFAWPYGAYTPETCKLMHDAGFAYGRTCEYTDNVTQCPDPIRIATSCHFQDNAFYQKYEAAKKNGVFYFWGHSYETMDLPQLWEQFEDKLRYITDDSDSEWANVIDIVPLCHA